MKIEMLETVKHDRLEYAEGETRVVDDALGAYFCSLGWARDVDGNVETRPRDPKTVVLTPDNVTMHNQTARVK